LLILERKAGTLWHGKGKVSVQERSSREVRALEAGVAVLVLGGNPTL